jgi:hypothetical protein
MTIVIKSPSRVQAYSFRLFCAALLLGCAARSGDRDSAFRRIQQHEANVARAEAALATEPCGEAAQRQLCGASRALCEESRALDDRDATARCLAAEQRCGAARERTRTSCATQARR